MQQNNYSVILFRGQKGEHMEHLTEKELLAVLKVAKARSSGRVKKPPLGLMVGQIEKTPSEPPSPNAAPGTRLFERYE